MSDAAYRATPEPHIGGGASAAEEMCCAIGPAVRRSGATGHRDRCSSESTPAEGWQ